MSPEEEVIVADLCEQIHDALENPDRMAWSEIRGLIALTLREGKALISNKQLLVDRCIQDEPEDF